MLSENELIKWLKNNAPLYSGINEGIGDDAAVLDYSQNVYQLFKVDSIAEGIHYDGNVDPTLIGRKALARPLSDIAAMGGEPVAALVSIAIDSLRTPEYTRKIFKGIFNLAEEFNVSIIGGDTIKITKGVVLSVSVLGRVNKTQICKRKGACIGDNLLITGKIGRAADSKHLSFTPRIKESLWLTNNFKINSMIDISDGLIGDLGKILEINKIGARLNTTSIPLDLLKEDTRLKVLKKALKQGEEYELLFTCDPKEANKIVGSKRDFDTPISNIGKITDQEGKVVLVDENGNEKDIENKGYDHFCEKRI